MGAHPNGVSEVLWDGVWMPLPDWIQENPEGILGEEVAERFSNRLPFLFKILAAAMPLSIQAHPDLPQAREGFARENRLKIPLDAPARNYKDENHKPEILCALTPFDALKGFREINEILARFGRLPVSSLADQIRLLSDDASPQGLAGFVSALLTLKSEDRRRTLSELIPPSERLAASDPVFAWVIRLHRHFPEDVGVFAPLLLNLIHLEPGEAIYIDSGELHSYLQGAGVELMADSDNVVRAGLTTKHADIPELLHILSFEQGPANIIKPQARSPSEWAYPTPAREFILSRISIRKESPHHERARRSLAIMICIEGTAEITDVESGEILQVSRGSAFLVPAMVKEVFMQGEATLYKATVPDALLLPQPRHRPFPGDH